MIVIVIILALASYIYYEKQSPSPHNQIHQQKSIDYINDTKQFRDLMVAHSSAKAIKSKSFQKAYDLIKNLHLELINSSVMTTTIPSLRIQVDGTFFAYDAYVKKAKSSKKVPKKERNNFLNEIKVLNQMIDQIKQ
jgi:hypothetical protein